MRALAFLGGFALIVGRVSADAEEVTKKNWEKEVANRVDQGQFVFVKFLAPW